MLEEQSFYFRQANFKVDPCCVINYQSCRYSSLDKMYERVLWAITNCESIDADFAAGEIQGPSIGGDSDGDE